MFKIYIFITLLFAIWILKQVDFMLEKNDFELGKKDARQDGLELPVAGSRQPRGEEEKHDYETELREILTDTVVIHAGRENEYEKPSPNRGKKILQLFPCWILASERFITLKKGERDRVLRYVDGVYVEDGDRWIRQFVKNQLDKNDGAEFSTMYYFGEILNNVKIATYEKNEKLNPYEYMNFQNGVLNLKTFEFAPHTPDLYFTSKTSYPYNPNADCPRFNQFLHEIQDDPKVILLLQEIAGYAFIPGYPHQYFFLLHGIGQNGKSKFLEALQMIIGEDYCASASFHDLVQDRFATSDLDGKRANICADITGERLPNIATIKRLTGDVTTVQQKGEQRYTLYNQAKLYFSANIAPPIGDKSIGALRRICLIPFRKNISEENRDIQLTEKFRTERSGILNWALEGTRRLIRAGKFTYPLGGDLNAVRDAYEQASDAMGLFVEKYIEEDDFDGEYMDGTPKSVSRLSTQEIYDVFCMWTEVYRIQIPIPKRKAFAAEFRTALGKLEMSYRKRGVFFYGLRFSGKEKNLFD
jgi:P4 family phage/plasmid primase-like protien